MASRAAINAIVLLPILMLSTPEVVQSNQNLTFMFITSFGRFGLNSSGAMPAADIALEAINDNPNILPGYNLVYDRVRDSEVSKSPCGSQIHAWRYAWLLMIYLSCSLLWMYGLINIYWHQHSVDFITSPQDLILNTSNWCQILKIASYAALICMHTWHSIIPN